MSSRTSGPISPAFRLSGEDEAMKSTRREFVIAMAATGLLPGCSAVAAASETFTPEQFGARGDGRTNDTDAFAAMSARVTALGAGTIVLRPVTYIVGKQARTPANGSKFGFTPSDIIHIVGCSGPVVIRGNGATLKCAPGLRYGAFDPQSGQRLADSRENLEPKRRAVPYLGMVHVENCSGSVEISDLELDGGLDSLEIGGGYAKHGWQAGASGIRLVGNTGSERLSRIHSHHHAQDGILLTGATARTTATSVSDCVCEDNGRVGCSITSGRNYSLARCKFRRSGKGKMKSLPAAGVDIEAEGGLIRDVSFAQCEFSDNAGFGMVAGSGDSEGATFTDCRFVGTTNWAAWPNKPKFRFSNCTFVGQIVHAYGDSDPSRAAQFVDCTFSDDPRLSPTGEVYGGRTQSHAVAMLKKSTNVLFSRCRFQLTHDMTLPDTEPDVIYADCAMSQASPAISRPLGVYLGTTTIAGNVDLTGSAIRGTVILNGRALPRTA